MSLLHSYVDPAHEQLLAEEIAERLPDCPCLCSRATWSAPSASTSALRRPRLTPRCRRCWPPTSAGSRDERPPSGLCEPLVMQSSGGLTDLARAGAHAALTVLSGPAGGVGGALLLAELAGEPDVLCFDMGGTSCDVCVIEDGEVRETAEREVAEAAARLLPALDIHTVGAGGGSIAWRDSGRRAARGTRLGGGRPRSGLLRPWRQRADRHRRQSAARPPARGRAARRRSATRSRRCRARDRRPGGRARAERARLRGRDRARRRGGDARCPAPDDRRARRRSARFCAGCRSAAPARCTPAALARGARNLTDPVPVRLRRAP